ncbi:hypothetical protein WH52_05790 [Tenacibaculum holothuriorum]|uniref:Uncharacterized protein n=1 Tax=Tenacibaculum holothuriorum TaxID=1635173 RepID=A0A1Y2PCS4_9FLAO|nr:hypothetical protein [Tenacibaculum holothuriorum]OSY88284.1 hypothetical protein WH52_05790 [Tenacibaculum holothuriorum]
MRKILLFLVFTSILNVNAQKCFTGKVEDLKKLTTRPLAVVVMPEEGNETIEELKKKISKTKKEKKKKKLQKELDDLIYNIKYFNTTVKEVVPEYWKLNDAQNITYLTKEEIEKLRKEKSTEFAVLNLTPDEVSVSGYNMYYTMSFNLMTYGKSEKKRTKATYRNHLVNTNFNYPKTNFKNKNQKKLIEELEFEKEGKAKVLSKENIIVTLILAQNIIEEALKTGEKISFHKYAENQSDKNKKELVGKKLLIQSAISGSKLYKQFEKYKDRVELVSAKRIADAIINKEDVYIGFPLIKKYVKAKSSFGPVGFVSALTMDHKVVFNPSKGKIISFRNAPSPLNYRSFKRKDIEKLFVAE